MYCGCRGGVVDAEVVDAGKLAVGEEVEEE